MTFHCSNCRSPILVPAQVVRRLTRGERVTLTCEYCGVPRIESLVGSPNEREQLVDERLPAPSPPEKLETPAAGKIGGYSRSAKDWIDESADMPDPAPVARRPEPAPAERPKAAWDQVLPSALPPAPEAAVSSRTVDSHNIPPPPFGAKKRSKNAPPAPVRAPTEVVPDVPPPAVEPDTSNSTEPRPSLFARFERLPKVIQYAALLVLFLAIGVPVMLVVSPPTPPAKNKGTPPAPATPPAQPNPAPQPTPAPQPPAPPRPDLQPIVEDTLPPLPDATPAPKNEPPKKEPPKEPPGAPDPVDPPPSERSPR